MFFYLEDLVLTQPKEQAVISNAYDVSQKNDEVISCQDLDLLYNEPGN